MTHRPLSQMLHTAFTSAAQSLRNQIATGSTFTALHEGSCGPKVALTGTGAPMKPSKRKLSLHAQTLRNLSTSQLGKVSGGFSSQRDNMCSTLEDTNCEYTGQCPTLGGSCITGCCDPHTANCSNFC